MFGKQISVVFVGGLLMLLASTENAYAYIEPGTGAMILQILLGGVAGFVVIGKLYWHRLKEIFVPGFKASKEDQENSEKVK